MYWIWFELQIETLTQLEMVLNHPKQHIKCIETIYPWSVSANTVLFLLTSCTVIWLVVLINFLWYIPWLDRVSVDSSPWPSCSLVNMIQNILWWSKNTWLIYFMPYSSQSYYQVLHLLLVLLISLLTHNFPGAWRWHPSFTTLRHHHLNLHLNQFQEKKYTWCLCKTVSDTYDVSKSCRGHDEKGVHMKGYQDYLKNWFILISHSDMRMRILICY